MSTSDVASTIAEWMTLVDIHEATARAVLPVPLAWGQCVFHLGLMVEALMKAHIMKLERFNTWPSRAAEPGLYVHDLRRLQVRAGLPMSPTHPLAPSLAIVLQWDRNQGYGHRPPPRAVVNEFVEAALGPDGVATWLRNNLP